MSKIRVYKYGLLPPTQNADLVLDQMRKAHNYRNALTEIERGRRAAVRELTRESDVRIQELETKLKIAEGAKEAAAREVKQQHYELRSREATKTHKDELKEAKAIVKTIKANLRQTRFETKQNEDVIAGKDVIGERAKELIRSSREYSGLYWGTYQIVEEAIQASAKSPLYDGAEPNDPRFVRWNGEGMIGVHFQSDQVLETKKAFNSSNTLMHIDKVDDKAFYSDKRSERSKASHTTLHIRIGSDDKGKPILASFPMIMHRPLPENGYIRWAKVKLKRYGNRQEWSVSITVDMSDVLLPTNNTNGAVAIDLGWRTMRDKDGEYFRVAKWRGEDGKTGEVKLTSDIVNALTKEESLNSIRDKNFNQARIKLVEWMENNTHSDWIKEATKTLSQWKSIVRFAKLIRAWSKNRFDEDGIIYQAMEQWRYHDHHLWTWESNQRIKALRRRKEFYRVIAAQLAEQYKTVVLEDFDLRDVSKTAELEDDDDNQKARGNKKLVAPSEFRLALINAFTARNGEVIKIDPKGTSYTCHLCGSKEHLDPTDHIHTCSQCKTTWDREDNATANILARYCERLSDAQNVVDARNDQNDNENKEVKETRYERRVKATQAKAARMATARRTAANIT